MLKVDQLFFAVLHADWVFSWIKAPQLAFLLSRSISNQSCPCVQMTDEVVCWVRQHSYVIVNTSPMLFSYSRLEEYLWSAVSSKFKVCIFFFSLNASCLSYYVGLYEHKNLLTVYCVQERCVCFAFLQVGISIGFYILYWRQI